MDRRLFFLAGTVWALRALPQDGGWKEGIHYVTLPSHQPTADNAESEVVEAFSYTCIHCYRFEAHIRAWLKTKPPSVNFIRLPSLWDERHRAHAQLYYTLRSLGRNDLDQAVFVVIHETKKPLFATDPRETLAVQAKFAQEHGIPADTFTRAYSSAAVLSRLQEAAELLKRFEVMETPAIIINGKYMTDGYHLRTSGDQGEEIVFARLIELTNYLLSLRH